MREWLVEIEELKEGYSDLYEYFLSLGLDKSLTLEKLRKAKTGEELYWKLVEGLSLQISYTMKELESIGWGEKSDKEKEEALWELGMDTKLNYSIQERRVMVGNSLEIEEVVWGQERLDEEWCNKKNWSLTNFSYYASEEARNCYWWNMQVKGR